jgi:alkanesulfonate monooxygenase SsuD/methylene tetrahydromethanopterin reductase-like flavin-dependent oxidoreductase (luciferase family)
VRAGLTLPIFDELADPRVIGELAAEAEAAGWDGVFVWDHVYYRPPVRAVTDPWIALACVAQQTSRVLLGPMVTPVARRRPQVLARQIAALDQLAPDRCVFGVGLGLDGSGRELSRFGEELDDRVRAEMLDEGLGLVRALLSGEPVDHAGVHYTAREVAFAPAPAQPVPIWVGARWPNQRPLRRAAAHDGLFLIDVHTPDELRRAVDAVGDTRGSLDGFDVVVQLADDADPSAWEAAGATWWLPDIAPFGLTVAAVRDRIRARAYLPRSARRAATPAPARPSPARRAARGAAPRPCDRRARHVPVP